MGIFKPIERICPWIIPPKCIAITLWPFIFYKNQKSLKDIPLRAHEYFHWRQALHWGVLPWYLAYLLLLPFYCKQSPDSHPMERKAYELQCIVSIALANDLSCECENSQCGCSTER